MPITRPGRSEVHVFPDAAALRGWLEANHATETAAWFGYYRKGIDKPSVTYPEAVDQALCFGWIDGITYRIDDEVTANRFTPRRKGSSWSAVNIAKVERLKAEGLMADAGLRAFEARYASPVVDEILDLPDGRRLGYRARGPRAGHPILYFHGQPASRLEADLIPTTVLERHAARLISFDRAGMGRSTYVPARDMLLDLPDAVALLDHLGIAAAGVIGVSAGGPWALAFAAAHPSRVRAVGLLSAQGPYDDERFMSENDIEERRQLRSNGADAMLAGYEAEREEILSDTDAAIASWFDEFPDDERQWATAGPAASVLASEATEALRQSARGWLRATEVRMMSWSFDPATIQAPVRALHGTDDAWEPLANIQRIIDTVPDAHLSPIPGGNHLAPVMHAEEVVAAVVSYVSPASGSDRLGQ